MARFALLGALAIAACGSNKHGTAPPCDGPGCEQLADGAVLVDAPDPPGPGAFPLWVAPSLELVRRDAPARTTTQIELWAARGETESFQIVARGRAGGLTNVNVTVPELAGAQLTLYREYYVTTGGSPNWHGSNQPLGPGAYPEGLVPFVDPHTGGDLHGAIDAVPFGLAADQDQPIWVDITVPRDATPGEYYGLFDVTSDQGDAKAAVVLHVRKFALPVKPALRSSFLSEHPSLEVAEELLANRLEIANIDPSLERTLIDRGYATRGAGFWSGADIGTCSMSAAPSSASFVADAATHAADIELYDYSADEIGGCAGLIPTIRAWGHNMHASRMKNLVTMAPRADLFDDGTGSGRSAVDIWVVLPVTYNGAQPAIAQALAKGDAVWSYNTLVQDAYSPKWEVDWDPINERIQPGFLSEAMSLTGLLYWRVDRWGSDPWNTAMGVIYPGDGILVYPGTSLGMSGAGVAPSIRLKRLRDGVDDYDYLELLKSLGHTDDALAKARMVGTDWTTWTRDHALLEAVRNQIGDEIDSLTP